LRYRKATSRAALARAVSGPRAVGEPGMHGTFMRENRETPPNARAPIRNGPTRGRLRP